MEEQQQEQRQLNWQSIKSAASVFAAEEAVNLIAHVMMGNTSGMAEGVIFGGIAALAAGYNAPKVLRQLREALPQTEELEPFWLLTRREPGKRSIMDRLLDRHPEESDEPEEFDDEVQEAYILNLGIAFKPHPNLVLSNRVVILGMPGAGKSNTVAVLGEELGQYDAPFIIFDQKPEYTKLCARPYFSRPYRANAENVTPEGAFAFGQKMMNERLQVVLDLTSYQNDDNAARVMIDIIKGVLAWEKQFEVDHRLPVTFFFEEADYWLPQSEQHAHIDRRMGQDKKSLFSQFQQTVFNLINRGRSFGMGTVVSTQRPANIDNRAIALAEWKILLKANMPNDLEVYKGFGLDPKAAKVLGKGEAFVIGPDIEGLYQIRLRESPDEASTPGLENIQNILRKPAIKEQIAQYNRPSLHLIENASSEMPIRRTEEPTHQDYAPRTYAHQEGQNMRQFEHETGGQETRTYAHKNDVRPGEETAHMTEEERTAGYPLLDAAKVERFAMAYEITGNVDESLRRAGANTRYREHARAIIKERSLRKQA